MWSLTVPLDSSYKFQQPLSELASQALKILFNNSKPFSCFHTMLCDGGILVVYDEDANTDSQEGIK